MKNVLLDSVDSAVVEIVIVWVDIWKKYKKGLNNLNPI